MPLLKMLIGLPGSGKSTFAQKLVTKEQGWVHLSSDLIAKSSIFPGESIDTQQVFAEMYRQTVVALRAGKDVIYDATNLTSRRRRSFLNRIKNFHAETEAVVFLTPYTILKERNQKRADSERVPEFVLERYIRSFQFPKMDEAFHKITIISNPSFPATNQAIPTSEVRQIVLKPDVSYQEILELYRSFQETKPLLELESVAHRSYRIFTSISKKVLDSEELELLSWVALLHAIGKSYVRKNLPIEEDNFYGYEHVAMYLSYPILSSLQFPEHFIIDALLLIDEHVEALHSKRGKLKRRLGLKNYERLEIFLEAVSREGFNYA
ncbi:ATP-binding protein [Planococcus shixiaomingii]|uniref:ATP-binding protein n=1 Tax=Planococcus shixiaomingii TaxID=3058393 RepID=UPI002606C308|nr:ATP-binding protein [Planococcus sp. N022]WKA55857.1 ATP-binding protein [Planococcus sp. N022]